MYPFIPDLHLNWFSARVYRLSLFIIAIRVILFSPYILRTDCYRYWVLNLSCEILSLKIPSVYIYIFQATAAVFFTCPFKYRPILLPDLLTTWLLILSSYMFLPTSLFVAGMNAACICAFHLLHSCILQSKLQIATYKCISRGRGENPPHARISIQTL